MKGQDCHRAEQSPGKLHCSLQRAATSSANLQLGLLSTRAPLLWPQSRWTPDALPIASSWALPNEQTNKYIFSSQIAISILGGDPTKSFPLLLPVLQVSGGGKPLLPPQRPEEVLSGVNTATHVAAGAKQEQ